MAFKQGTIPWNKGQKGLQVSWNKGKKHTAEHLRNSSDAHKGYIPSLETRKKLSLSLKGKPTWNKGSKTGPRSDATKKKISAAQAGVPRKKHSEQTRRMLSGIALKGDKSPLWKGGITPVNQKIRTSLEYRLWRDTVYRRDNYTCIWCRARNGNGKRVVLNADHIKPFAYFPELRFAIDNGRTLCRPCHQTTETYGSKCKK